MNLQEVIVRGRFIFSKSPEKLKVFEVINGKRNTREIAEQLDRHVNAVRRDLRLIEDIGLIQQVLTDGEPLRKDGLPVYEKIPIAGTIPIRYFREPTRLPKSPRIIPVPSQNRSRKAKVQPVLQIPTEQQILDIARHGEDQIYEFKSQGTDIKKITNEIGAFLNTRQGGMILYGIDDNGNIEGTDISRQDFDQPMQNSIKNTIDPPATVRLTSVDVMGSEVIVIIVPPWNLKDVYHTGGKVLIRRGTNAFTAKAEEAKRLYNGEIII